MVIWCPPLLICSNPTPSLREIFCRAYTTDIAITRRMNSAVTIVVIHDGFSASLRDSGKRRATFE
ncbi:hypothetical protein EMIT0196MI5_160118 [Pseudomonas sp. IT-196MI5]